MPRGAIIVGHRHRRACLNFLLAGSLLLVMDGYLQPLNAPAIFRSEAGVRKVAFILSDTVWATVHATEETDMEKLEADLIIKSEAFLEAKEAQQLIEFVGGV